MKNLDASCGGNLHIATKPDNEMKKMQLQQSQDPMKSPNIHWETT